MGRFDRPDPGSDPDYCDGLEPEDIDTSDMDEAEAEYEFRRPLTRAERLQELADSGVDTWDEYEERN